MLVPARRVNVNIIATSAISSGENTSSMVMAGGGVMARSSSIWQHGSGVSKAACVKAK